MPADVVNVLTQWLLEACEAVGLRLERGPTDRRALRKAVSRAVSSVLDQAAPSSRNMLEKQLQKCFSSPPAVRDLEVGGGLQAAVSVQLARSSQSGKFSWAHGPPHMDANWLAEELSAALMGELHPYLAARDLGGLTDARAEQSPTPLPPNREGEREGEGGTAEAHNLMTAGSVSQAVQAGAVHGGVHVYGAVESLAAATHTLPRDIASFTGRASEIERLMQAVMSRVSAGRVIEIIAIDGMAGVGKTTLAVHVAYQLAAQFPDGQIFLRLYGHTPGHKPVDPADALGTLLLNAGVPPQQIPPGLDARAALWRDRTAGKRMLLLLDDASSSAQVTPLLPGGADSLVLLTSRRRLLALPDTLLVSLEILKPWEARDLLVRLTGLPGEDSGVTDVVKLCGYLPLAISLIAGQLKHHGVWTATDLANELASSKDRLESMRAEDDSVAAAFDLSYRDLTADQQLLFCRLGLHPGADFDGYAAAALADTDLRTVRMLLDGLFTAHLVDEPVRSRYRFHDLISEHARSLTTSDSSSERDAAVKRLMSYYVATARAADLYLARRAPSTRGMALDRPIYAPDFTARDQAVYWMNMERLNLHAIADYAALTRQSEYTLAIAAAMHAFLRAQGHWDQAASIHRASLAEARRSGNRSAEAGALQDLGDIQRLMGDFSEAAASQENALTLYREIGNRHGEADALNHLGFVLRRVGDYPSAAERLESSLRLYHELGDRRGEADALNYLGDVQRLTGEYAAAAISQEKALILYREMDDQHGEANALCSQGEAWRLCGDYATATACLVRAAQLARDLGNRNAEANALNYLGDVQLSTGDSGAATVSQERALRLYRELGNRHGEANALNYLGNVQCLTGAYSMAMASQERALSLYRELGNRHGEAQTLISIGALSLATAELTDALGYYELGLMIASDIGARFEEAQAIEGIGQCHAQTGRPGEAADFLQQAFCIYQSIGSPSAERVEIILSDLDRA